LVVFFISNVPKHISTQITSILPAGENKELLREFEKLNTSKQLFIAYKGDDTKALEGLKKLENDLLQNKNIHRISNTTIDKEYEKKYYYLVHKFNETKYNSLNIKEELTKLHQKIISSPFSFSIDTIDPLNLFEKNNLPTSPYIKIDNFGYITFLQLDKSVNNFTKYKEIYDITQKLKQEDSNRELFSTIFYFVENQEKIKSDVNIIITLALTILFILYIMILKNFKLLIHTITTLGSSILFALILSSLIFEELSIFTVIFGISISTIAIDYMFHNYLHGYYEEKRSINKDVFFGMITTLGGLFILSFVNFTFIEQLTYFAIFALLFSYIQFTFLFPYLNIQSKQNRLVIKKRFTLKPRYITFISIFIIALTIPNIKTDFNIKNLDVDNIELDSLDNFFNTYINKEKKTAVLLYATSVDELVNNAHKLKNKYPKTKSVLVNIPTKKSFENFDKKRFETLNNQLNQIAVKVGFRENIFKNSYTLQNTPPKYSYETLDKFPIGSYQNIFISYAIVANNDYKNIIKEPYIKALSFKELFQEDLKNSLKTLELLSIVALLFICGMLYLAVKRNFFKAFNYILFPITFIFCLSFFIEFNILHIFMMIVVVSLSIDYGIYMNNSNLSSDTQKAIIYSLLSTFAGFGVLIFSSINALFSIGLIATLGIVSLIILLLTHKVPQ
jgi:predicted RND superfamily exporter protein